MPSTVRSRIRSDSNSATMASTLNRRRPNCVGRVVDGPAEREADLSGGQLVRDGPRIGQGPCQAVELRDHQGVPTPASGQGLAQARAFSVGAGQAVIDVDAFGLDAEAEQGIALGGEVLLIGGASGVPDK